MIESAFILAAGRGERLRPLTDTTPKPLLPVQGRPILSHLLDKLKTEIPELKKVVLNAWHLKEQIVSFAEKEKKNYPFQILVSQEDELLGTGGGLKKALPLLGSAPFLMMNGDCLWKGDLKKFISSSIDLKTQKGISTWWLTEKNPEQTAIGYFENEILQIGKLWKAEGRDSQNEGCFSGIQLIHDIDPDLLPDQGCILRNYFIARLISGAKLSCLSSGLKNWTDIGTPDRYARIS